MGDALTHLLLPSSQLGSLPMADLPAGYPSEWQTDVILRDGATARLRPILPTDRDALAAFHGRQSRDSIYFRFFRYRPELSDDELTYFTEVDYKDRMAFVAIVGDELVAVARYERWPSSAYPDQKMAEVAFFVDDANHGRGLATLMLEYLAAVARAHDYDGFTASVLPQNVAMLGVFRRAGFDVSTKFADGVVEVTLGIEVTKAGSDAIAERGRRAQAASVRRLLEPASIAVVGASRQAGSPGHELLRRLVRADFSGTVVGVNPAGAGTEVDGVPIVGSLAEVPEPPELLVVAVPASQVSSVVDDAIAAGSSGAMVVSSGFSDAGNVESEAALVATARSHGLRMIGPNSFGVLVPRLGLDATMLPHRYRRGSAGVVSESGPLGAGLLDALYRAGLGVSSFVGLGNRADVSVSDLMAYWAEDPTTEVVVAYLENWGNPRNVLPTVADLTHHKPVVSVRPGNPNLAAALANAGVTLVDRVADMVVQTTHFSRQPVAAGRRVTVVTNSPSVGRLAVGAARGLGLEPVVPKGMGHGDLLLIGDADVVAAAAETGAKPARAALVGAATAEDVDAVIAAIVPAGDVDVNALGRLLQGVDRAVDTPLVSTGLVDPAELGTSPGDTFAFPEDAAAVLARSADLGRWRAVVGERLVCDDPEPLDAAVASILGSDDGPVTVSLGDDSCSELLAAVGVAPAPFHTVRSGAEAAAAATELGFPVVVKPLTAATRGGVGEAGGVAIDVRSADEAAEVFRRLIASGPSPNQEDRDAVGLVQTMIVSGATIAIRSRQDSQTGSRIEIGPGGSTGAAIGPMLTLALPTSIGQIRYRIDRSPWLGRVLGAGVADRLVELVAAVAAAFDGSDRIQSLMLDPVAIGDEELAVLDVSATLAEPQVPALAGLRALANRSPRPPG